MEWKTSITSIQNGKELVRGYDLHELIQKSDFVSAIFLVSAESFPMKESGAC